MADYFPSPNDQGINYNIKYLVGPGFTVASVVFQLIDPDTETLLGQQILPLEINTLNTVEASGSLDTSILNLTPYKRYRLDRRFVYTGYSGSINVENEYYTAMEPESYASGSFDDIHLYTNKFYYGLNDDGFLQYGAGVLKSTRGIWSTDGNLITNKNVYVNFSNDNQAGSIFFHNGLGSSGGSIDFDRDAQRFNITPGNESSNSGTTLHGKVTFKPNAFGQTTEVSGSLFVKGNVTVGNNYTLPRVDGTSSYVLTTNGAGGVTWQAPAGLPGPSGSGVELAVFTGYKQISGSLNVLGEMHQLGNNMYINWNGPDDQAFIYIRAAGSNTGAWIRYNYDESRFELSNPLYLTGNIETEATLIGANIVSNGSITAAGKVTATGGLVAKKPSTISGSFFTTGNIQQYGNKLYINYDGPDSDSFIYFYAGGTPTTEYLKFDDSSYRFEFSDSLFVGGNVDASTITGSTLISNGDIYVNYDGVDGVSSIYFYDGGATTGQYLKWNDAGAFEISSNLIVAGYVRAAGTGAHLYSDNDIYVNYGGPAGNSNLFFHAGGVDTAKYLRWDDGRNIFQMNDALFIGGKTIQQGSSTVSGSLFTTGNITVGNAYTLPRIDGSANQVLTTDGAGNVDWQASGNDIVALSLKTHADAGQWSQNGSGDLFDVSTVNGTKIGYLYLDMPSQATRLTVTGSIEFTIT